MLEKLQLFSSKIVESIELHALSRNIDEAGLAEKLKQLMPSVYIILATLGSLLVLLIILTKFLYNPINKMVKNRKDFIKNNIDQSIKSKEKAYELELEARENLKDSRNLSQELVSKARVDAESIKNQYIQQGKQEAERLIKEAKDDIKSRKRKLEKESYNEIVSIAMEISEKIIKDRISESETKKYLDEYLESKNND